MCGRNEETVAGVEKEAEKEKTVARRIELRSQYVVRHLQLRAKIRCNLQRMERAASYGHGGRFGTLSRGSFLETRKQGF